MFMDNMSLIFPLFISKITYNIFTNTFSIHYHTKITIFRIFFYPSLTQKTYPVTRNFVFIKRGYIFFLLNKMIFYVVYWQW